MTIILIIFCIWGVSALERASKEAARQKEIERQRREQAARSAELARMTAEWKQRQAEAKAETARLIAVEREQMRQAREQEKLAKEQEKQAAQLAKHEKRLADLEYRVSQAESDIEFLNDRIAQLDAQRDYLLLQQSGTVPGGKEHTKYQTKIISIDNQIHTAENKLSKAQHIKTMAKKEIETA
jgi:hypothetical protein